MYCAEKRKLSEAWHGRLRSPGLLCHGSGPSKTLATADRGRRSPGQFAEQLSLGPQDLCDIESEFVVTPRTATLHPDKAPMRALAQRRPAGNAAPKRSSTSLVDMTRPNIRAKESRAASWASGPKSDAQPSSTILHS